MRRRASSKPLPHLDDLATVVDLDNARDGLRVNQLQDHAGWLIAVLLLLWFITTPSKTRTSSGPARSGSLESEQQEMHAQASRSPAPYLQVTHQPHAARLLCQQLALHVELAHVLGHLQVCSVCQDGSTSAPTLPGTWLIQGDTQRMMSSGAPAASCARTGGSGSPFFRAASQATLYSSASLQAISVLQ